MHYERGLIGRIKDAGLTPVTIAIGGTLVWQGGVTVSEQLQLLAVMQDLESKHPLDGLPAVKVKGAKSETNGNPGNNPPPSESNPAKPPAPAQPDKPQTDADAKGNPKQKEAKK